MGSKNPVKSLFKYLLTASDLAKKNLRADAQERLIKREIEGKIDSLETKSYALESDLLVARQDIASATAENIKSKLQKVIDIRLDMESTKRAQEFLQEELDILFNQEFTPPEEDTSELTPKK